MRITCILLLAALGATGQWRASGVVVPPISNRVALTWDSLGPGTQYYVQTSTNLLTWTTATNTTATNVSLAFVGGQARMFRLSVSNAPTRSITLAWDASVPATNVRGLYHLLRRSPGSYTNQGGGWAGHDWGGVEPGGGNDLLLCRDRLFARRLGVGLLERSGMARPKLATINDSAVAVTGASHNHHERRSPFSLRF